MPNKFSIITVVKDDVLGLKATLQSISSQNYKHIQSIVIDGASEKNLQDIIKKYKVINKFISEPDNGIYDAMNKGIKFAKGTWTIFLNANDTFEHSDTLKELDKYITNNKGATLICGTTKETLNNSTITRPFYPISNMPFTMPTSHQSIVYKTEVLRHYPYNTNYKICADLEQLARMIKDRNAHIFYVPITVSCTQAEGFSTHNFYDALAERKLIQKTYYNNFFTTIKMFVYISNLKLTHFLKKLMSRQLFLKIRTKYYIKNAFKQ